ncbi:MAG: UDP-N-acetylmuramoyl-L-alanyl-D-glutamate--2,6-diaminopimelate ligase [Pseudomonadota bacterium]
MKLSNLLNAFTDEANKELNSAGRVLDRQLKNAALSVNQSDQRDPEIGSVHYRAQDVKPNGLFVAIKGLVADGHDFIDEAAARGASAIITQKPVTLNRLKKRFGNVNTDPVVIETEDSRRALALISGRFFGNPSEHLKVVGITGTNGKTTTAYLIESILGKAGFRVGVIGTQNYRFSGKTFKNPMTTPESLDLQRILADMLMGGVTHVAMEVTSHAIDLFRVGNCHFDVGIFTNLSQDHLDYHGDMDAYWSCKKRFFTRYLCSGPKKDRSWAVINCSDARGKELLTVPVASMLTTGHSEDNMIRPQTIRQNLAGLKGTISTPTGIFDFTSALVGKHNLENILSAAGAGIALDLPVASIKEGIEAVSGVPGRLERIPNDTDRFVYVDYAHSPDALENVLSCLRTLTKNRIVCVFGCGGNRDKEKRPQMGEIAARLADLSIITSDNPRTEAPMKIIEQVLMGTKNVTLNRYMPSDLESGFQRNGYVAEPDREKAIRLGISASKPGDTVLIAGKGDETYQIIGGETIPFDDRETAKKALQALV